MDIEEIIACLNRAKEKLLLKDSYLLVNNAHDRTISQRLAVYLTEEFKEYDVDCEYNHVWGYKKYKHIEILISKCRSLNKKIHPKIEEQIKEGTLTEDSLIELEIYPDIIIHKRGSNDNLVVIECKKDYKLNPKDREYDEYKLSCCLGSELNYYCGFFILFETSGKKPNILIQKTTCRGILSDI